MSNNNGDERVLPEASIDVEDTPEEKWSEMKLGLDSVLLHEIIGRVLTLYSESMTTINNKKTVDVAMAIEGGVSISQIEEHPFYNDMLEEFQKEKIRQLMRFVSAEISYGLKISSNDALKLFMEFIEEIGNG